MYQRKRFSVFGSALVGMSLFLSLFSGGCTTKARIPVTGLEVPVPDIPLPAVLRGENDLRSRPWSKAFDILHTRLQRDYAYSEHKGINWQALYEETAPKVLAAEETKDRAGWYRALRTYLYQIPDGNVLIDANELLRDRDEGGSAGLALAQLADSSVIVADLVEEGPADTVGIARGATILTWNDKPVAEALAATKVFWADNPAATSDALRQQQLTWLPRGPEGAVQTITFMNPGDTETRSARVVLEMDGFEHLALNRPLWTPVELFDSPVKTRLVNDTYRYVRVAAIAPTLSTPFPVRDFKAAVRLAVKEEATGLLLDLRGTQGGDATLVPNMLTCLVSEETFFETPGEWDTELLTYLVESEDTVHIKPELPVYEGPIVLLVDSYTMGPAESFAGFLAGRDNVRVFGASGTHGSAGVPTVDLILPGNFVIMYPARRSLDEAGAIQGVSNEEGVGNVVPDPVFTLDRTSAAAIYKDGNDAVFNKAIELLDSATWRFP